MRSDLTLKYSALTVDSKLMRNVYALQKIGLLLI